MEAAALATVSAFRGATYGQALYISDTLYGEQWDNAGLVKRDANFRYELLLTATHACARL